MYCQCEKNFIQTSSKAWVSEIAVILVPGTFPVLILVRYLWVLGGQILQ